MRFLTARRLVLAAGVPALFALSVIPGCSNESEGERCGDSYTDPGDPGTPNNDDCASPLICVAADTLVDNGANRCCYSDATEVNDSRCLRSTASIASGGSSGSAGSGGVAGTGGTGETPDASMNDADADAGAPDLGAGGA